MRVWLGSGPALGRTLPPRRPGRIAVLALAASGFSGAARPPPLKRTARPPRGARAEYEEEKFAVPGGGGEPEPSDPPFSSVRGGGRVPGGPPGGPELRSGGWRLDARPKAAEELLLRAVAAGPGHLQELSGIGRGRAGSLFHGDSSRVPAAAAAAAESPFVLLGPPSFPVSLPLSVGGSR